MSMRQLSSSHKWPQHVLCTAVPTVTQTPTAQTAPSLFPPFAALGSPPQGQYWLPSGTSTTLSVIGFVFDEPPSTDAAAPQGMPTSALQQETEQQQQGQAELQQKHEEATAVAAAAAAAGAAADDDGDEPAQAVVVGPAGPPPRPAAAAADSDTAPAAACGGEAEVAAGEHRGKTCRRPQSPCACVAC